MNSESPWPPYRPGKRTNLFRRFIAGVRRKEDSSVQSSRCSHLWGGLLNVWASLVAQTVKNLRALLETWVQSLGWEHPLEEGMATRSSILAWRIPMDRGGWWATDHGIAKSWTRLSDLAQHRNGRLAASVSGGSRWWLRWWRICLQCRRPKGC